MSVKGVIITKEQPAIGVILGEDSTSGLLANGVAVSGKLVLNTTYVLRSIRDAEALGLNADYDLDNDVVVFHHIKEFYSQVGIESGTKLYLMVVAQSVTYPNMVDVAQNYAKKLIDDAEGEVFQLAVAHNPVLVGGTPYTPVMTTGIDANLVLAIPKAQALAEYAFGKMYPVRFILEGKFFNPAAATIQDLRDLTASAEAVSVVVGQDYDFADSHASFNNYAAVGTALGTVASAAVNQSIGEVGAFNLSDVAAARWVNAGFSNKTKVVAAQELWQGLNDKGYIFPLKYSRLAGFRWNGDHTCAPILVGSDGTLNECYIRYSRTLDKAALNVYAALLPSVKSSLDLLPNGKLPVSIIADFRAKCENQIDRSMIGEISGRKVVVDKDSDLLPPEPELLVSVIVQPKGVAEVIKVKLKLSKQL